MEARTFNDVTLVAEHVPETHPSEGDLPGSVHVYLKVDGGLVPFTTFKASKVLDAIDAAQSQEQTTAGTSGQSGTTQAQQG